MISETPAQTARHARVAAGLAELERWLGDQVRLGLGQAGDRDWDDLAKRLVDAQAAGAAGMVARLERVRSGSAWPGALLSEYALLNLLAVAYRRRASLPPGLARTVLTRVGFTTSRAEVLAGAQVRDRWLVLGVRDEALDHVTARRVWLRGQDTGRPALILTFTPAGHPMDETPPSGATREATLAFYPAATPLRALIAPDPADAPDSGQAPAPSPAPSGNAAAPDPADEPLIADARDSGEASGLSEEMGGVRGWVVGREVPGAVSVEAALEEVAGAVAADPWTDAWPLLLGGVVPGRTELGGLPLHPACHDLWRLIAVSGGGPVTVAAEWTPRGLRPLTVWDDDARPVAL
ncbi:SWIM zinc finger family protein [Nonomuraea sp. NPDC050790]|uniref:SWIM zinc finger family protein n=1 Tax=Nonomuraea sp. NPDC050790 TaxID=3364371 RepID=UPI0037AF1B77